MTGRASYMCWELSTGILCDASIECQIESTPVCTRREQTESRGLAGTRVGIDAEAFLFKKQFPCALLVRTGVDIAHHNCLLLSISKLPSIMASGRQAYLPILQVVSTGTFREIV